jgi:hypothetical protein
MAKRNSGTDEPKEALAPMPERTPPGLSEELVAKLQRAVAAAQRRHHAHPERRKATRVDFAKSPGVPASSIDEWELYVTPGGRGRAAIARRDDGRFCIYLRWRVSGSWMDEEPDPNEVASPEDRDYGTLEEARIQVARLRGFSGAILRYSRDEPGRPVKK